MFKNQSKTPIADDVAQDGNLFDKNGDHNTPDDDNRYDDQIITEDVTEEAQSQLLDEGVNSGNPNNDATDHNDVKAI